MTDVRRDRLLAFLFMRKLRLHFIAEQEQTLKKANQKVYRIFRKDYFKLPFARFRVTYTVKDKVTVKEEV